MIGGSCITFDRYSIYCSMKPLAEGEPGSLDGPYCQSSKVIHHKLLLKAKNNPWDTHSSVCSKGFFEGDSSRNVSNCQKEQTPNEAPKDPVSETIQKQKA